jgi:hypothetical protein
VAGLPSAVGLMPNWQGSDRAKRLPRDWPARRRFVMDRAGWRCQWMRTDTGDRCPELATDCDHITPGDNHDVANLQALCGYHHSVKSGREGRAGSDADRQPGGRWSRMRERPTHPGYAG